MLSDEEEETKQVRVEDDVISVTSSVSPEDPGIDVSTDLHKYLLKWLTVVMKKLQLQIEHNYFDFKALKLPVPIILHEDSFERKPLLRDQRSCKSKHHCPSC